MNEALCYFDVCAHCSEAVSGTFDAEGVICWRNAEMPRSRIAATASAMPQLFTPQCPQPHA